MSLAGSEAAKRRWAQSRANGTACKPASWYEEQAIWNGECLEYKKSSNRTPRHIYQLRHGPLHKTIFVLHKCDNRFCIRDEHHFTGTQKDNIVDAVNKGRHSSLRPQSAESNAKRSASVKATLAAKRAP